MSNDRHHDESGVALIAALLAVVILTGLAVVFVATAVFESRATGNERRFETAIHTAEAATDDVILNVNGDLGHSTTYDGTSDHVYLAHGGDTYTDEEEWARAVADATDAARMTTTGFGEAIGIRPVDSTGDPMDLVFGVGYIPNRADALSGSGRIRVVKLQIQPGVFSPAQAFLVNGDLTIGGGAQTDGITGNVHANGNVFVEGQSGDCSGSGLCVRGRLSMTGTLRKGPAPSGPEFTDGEQETFDTEHVCPLGDPFPCEAEHIEEGAQHKDVPAFHASFFYEPSKKLSTFTSGGTVDARWWILCPDGDVKKPAGDSTHPRTICGDDTNHEPFWVDGQTNNFHGWDWNNSCGDFGNNPCWTGDKVVSGAFFVYNSNAVTNGGRGAVSVMVSCDGGSATDAELLDDATVNPCDSNGDKAGNYFMKGQPDFVPAYEGIHFIVDRDIIINGQAGTEIDGAIMAREQVRAEGQGDIRGSIVANNCHVRDNDPASNTFGECLTRHSTNSPVEQNSAKGSFVVDYNERLRIGLPGITRIIAWNEL